MAEIESENVGFTRSRLLLVIIILIIIIAIVLAIMILPKLKNNRPNNIPAGTSSTESIESGDLIPRDAKNPEDFMSKVKEKSDEIKKNYDANLVGFAEKKWKKFFLEQNGLNNNQIESNFKIEKQEVVNEDNGSTIFKITYRYQEDEYSDFYYLMLSESKIKEIGITGLSANRFLSEQEIRKNLNQPNFAKISKINK